MKIRILCIAILISSVAAAQSKKELMAEVTKLKAEIEQMKKPKEADISTEVKKVSYGVGVLISSNLKSNGGDSLDVDAISTAFGDVYNNRPLKVEKQEANAIVQAYMQRVGERKMAQVKTASGDFLKTNKTKPGVITTASGLQYLVIKSGTGPTAKATDRVTVNYSGKTIDGNEFDSSARSGKPAEFMVGEVVQGWQEVLQLMRAGDKWMVYIPYDLGYGERGNGQSIPPYSTLVFELELLKIN